MNAALPMVAAGDEPPWPDDAVEVGRIVGAFGVKGAFKVLPFAADPQALFSSRRWFLARPQAGGPRTQRPGLPGLLRITQAREHGDAVVASAQGIDDRDAALALTGAGVFVPRSSFPTPEVDEFYWVDLIGLAVCNREGQDLGCVEGLIETGPHCVLRLSSTDDAGQPRMVPFVAAYVDRVDLAGRRIDVDWPADF